MDSVVTDEQDAMVRTCARRVAREVRISSVEIDELVGEGYVGLLEAKKRFEPSRGVKLEAFAYPRVRGRMIDWVRGMARFTRKVHAACERLALMDSAMQEVGRQQAKGDDPVDPLALAARLDEATALVAMSFAVSSIAEAERNESGEDAEIRELDKKRLHKAIAALPEREQTVLVGLYWHNRLLQDLGDELRISESRASRAHTNALALLKKRLT